MTDIYIAVVGTLLVFHLSMFIKGLVTRESIFPNTGDKWGTDMQTCKLAYTKVFHSRIVAFLHSSQVFGWIWSSSRWMAHGGLQHVRNFSSNFNVQHNHSLPNEWNSTLLCTLINRSLVSLLWQNQCSCEPFWPPKLIKACLVYLLDACMIWFSIMQWAANLFVLSIKVVPLYIWLLNSEFANWSANRRYHFCLIKCARLSMKPCMRSGLDLLKGPKNHQILPNKHVKSKQITFLGSFTTED